MNIKTLIRSILLLASLFSLPLLAEEAINMEGMSVIGNKESPNLLYIVPWKSSKMPDLENPMISSRLFDEALEPVEREELVRRKLYREARQNLRNK